MSFLDALFGRRLRRPSNLDRIFSLPAATITLKHELGLRPSGAAALSFKPVTSGQFADLERELREFLALSARQTQSDLTISRDRYGYQWIELRDPNFEDLVTTLHLVSSSLEEQGFGQQLLASIFRFEREQGPAYLIYNYRRGYFYPFIPKGERPQRDNPAEIRLGNLLSPELSIEPEHSRWYPMWELPL